MKTAQLRKGKPYLFSDVKTWGGKGDNLLKLSQVFDVPQGFILSSDTYTDWIKYQKLADFIEESLQKNPQQAYEAIRTKFSQAKFKGDLTSKLEDEFSRMERPIAVRSSSISEDGTKNSFAGQHESVLGVTDFKEFLDAVKTVYASLFTSRAIEYRKSQSLSTEDAIAVVVQNMINPKTSGVAYSPSPSNLDEILIESTWGLCTSVVDGRSCDIYRVIDTVTGDTIQDISPKKKEMDVFDKRKKSVITEQVPFLTVKAPSLEKSKVLEVAKMIKQIERAYGRPMDMEFAYDNSGKLYVLQARPLTSVSYNERNVKLPNIPQNRILARSKNVRNQGIFEGPAVVVRLVDHANQSFTIDGDILEMDRKYSNGYVLISPEVPPQLEQVVTNAKGMYATECGTTGHAAAIACEKGIVYLGRGDSIPNLLTTVRSGTKVGIASSKDEGILYLA